MNKTELAQAIYTNFSTMRRLGLAEFNTAAKSVGLSIPQAELLFKIKENQPISFKALAEQLVLTPGSITQTVDALLADDLVQRETSNDDRRVACLSLTDHGTNVLAKLSAYRSEKMNRFSEVLTEQELKQLLAIQKKLIESKESKGAH